MTKELKRDIQAIVEAIKTKYHPEKIILFGSAARGEFEERSDLDFLLSSRQSYAVIVGLLRFINF